MTELSNVTTGLLGVAGILGLANIAGAVYLIKLVIAPLAQTVKLLNESVKELYESRDKLNHDVTELQTIHRIKGCDAPYKTEAMRG
jgi:hypothetical protein